MEQGYYLGLDIGTQSVKGVCTNCSGDVVIRASVVYDTALAQFGTNGGMHVDAKTARVTVPVRLWLSALERLFNNLRKSGLDFAAVRAVGGAAQQHGSIYWSDLAKLDRLDPELPLDEQVSKMLSLPFAPIWADSTTTQECLELEESYGGPLELARLTGKAFTK